MDRRLWLTGALAALGAQTPLPAFAQSYPERPIRVYQGFAAGGNADMIARAVGTEMSKGLGQPLVIESQAGAGGTLAANTVAHARADGYTLLLATGGHAVAGAMFNTLPYKTVADFEPISTLTAFPFLLVVRTDHPSQSLVDLLALARSPGSGVAFGSAGIGSTHHLAGELLGRMAKVELLHVPYRGDAASVAALLSGDVPLIIAPPTAVLSHLHAGKLRALAVSSATRWNGLPNIPTVAEQGVAGFDVRSWAGLLAPAGTPRSVIDRLHAEAQRALIQPSVKSRLEAIGGEATGSTPEEMKTMLASELQRWSQLVADAHIPKQ
jgi:tripartite-type tricarboxylate transporter receptor subunit TctC